MEGWFFLVAALLVWSGLRKVADPASTSGALRAAGLPSSHLAVFGLAGVEIVVGLAALLTPHPAAAWAVATVYTGFAAFVALAMSRRLPIASCGCFGRADTPPTWVHLTVNLAAIAGAVGAALNGRPDLPSVLAQQPLAGLAYGGFLVMGVYLFYLLLSELPRLQAR